MNKAILLMLLIIVSSCSETEFVKEVNITRNPTMDAEYDIMTNITTPWFMNPSITSDVVFVGKHKHDWISLTIMNVNYCLYIGYEGSSADKYCHRNPVEPSARNRFRAKIYENHLELYINDNIDNITDFKLRRPLNITEAHEGACYNCSPGSIRYGDNKYEFHGIIEHTKVMMK